MLRVGLTGGLASGKSLIASELARLGCHVIEADSLGHEVLRPGGEAYEAVVNEFTAAAILEPDGTINRRRLAAIVFEHPERLKALTAIVHPAVRRLSLAKSAALNEIDRGGILIYEAAILVETGGFRDFEKLIVAACPEEVQIERAMARDNSTREAVLARLQQQLPLSEKVRYADFVVDTSGSKEQTVEQTRSVFERLKKEVRQS
jgi:dephospho-CoA kinase